MTNPDPALREKLDRVEDIARKAYSPDPAVKEYKGVKFVPDESIPPGEFHMMNDASCQRIRDVAQAARDRELAAARAAGIEEGRLQGLREAAGLQFPEPPCYFDGDQAYGFECGCEALLQAILARIGGAE